MVGESIPQTGSSCTEGAVAHGSEPCPPRLEEVGLSRAEMAWGGLGGDEFFKVEGGSAIEALVGQQGDFEFNPVLDR